MRRPANDDWVGFVVLAMILLMMYGFLWWRNYSTEVPTCPTTTTTTEREYRPCLQP